MVAAARIVMMAASGVARITGEGGAVLCIALRRVQLIHCVTSTGAACKRSRTLVPAARTIALRNHAGFAAANAFKNIWRELSQNCSAVQPYKTTVVQGINLRAVTRQ
jgi:hypothetical protein